jgi:DNA-binding beta-propeller fold protein YncE
MRSLSPASWAALLTCTSLLGEALPRDEFLATVPGSCQITYIEFSPDQKEFACVQVEKKRHSVAVNGKAGAHFDEVTQLQHLEDIGWVYIGKQGDREVLVVNGVAGKFYERIARAVRISSGQFGYEVSDKGQAFVVVNHVEGPRYERIDFLNPGPAGKYAYTASRGGKEFLVLNGKEQESHIHVSDSVFSPGGQLAYSAWNGKNALVVLNGKIVGSHALVRSKLFNQDEKLAYHAVDDLDAGEEYVVFAGKPGRRYDAVEHLFFSPSGQPVYQARRGRDSFYVVGTRELPPFEVNIFPGGSTFSPQGEFAFRGQHNGKRIVVRGGQPGPGFEWVDFLTYSPTGRLAYAAIMNGKDRLMLDGSAEKWYRGVSEITFSPDGQHVAYRAWDRGKQFYVVDQVEGPAFERVAMLRFSSDSRSFSYLAVDDKRRVWRKIVRARRPGSSAFCGRQGSPPASSRPLQGPECPARLVCMRCPVQIAARTCLH